MIQNTITQQQIQLRGGLDYETPGTTAEPGRMLNCQGFEIGNDGGYRLMSGYERFDGGPEPHLATGDGQIDRRNAIQQVPGSGPIRGVHVANGRVYAFRDSLDESGCHAWIQGANGWFRFDSLADTGWQQPGGRYQFVNWQFTSDSDEQTIAVDGLSKALYIRYSVAEKRTYFAQITIPGDDTPPSFCTVLNNVLFLGTKRGSIYYSAVNDPTDFNVAISGAGELSAGGELTGLYPLVGGALCIQTRNRISILYGSSPEEWVKKDIQLHDSLSGALPYSSQTYSDLYFIGDRGITSLTATQQFGSFASGTFSKSITPFIQSRKQFFRCSVQSLEKNQLRWVFDPGAASLPGSEIITATFAGGKLAGFTRQVLDFTATCSSRGETPDGSDLILMGSDDGWVYRMDVGTSFDGLPISAYFMTAFGNSGSPSRKKSYKRVTINIQADGPVPISAKPIFDYGDSGIASHRVEGADVAGGASFYDSVNWDEFTWSSPQLNEIRLDATGRARNMALLINTQSDTTRPFSMFDILVDYSVGGLQR